ncbi:GATA transcription factor 12 [Platanthera zijinensis]|uniref:GATA transcription factor 12 n=1 Tax=Platanthera zijinensis TaxID=2320716 RepID=A0AAP0GBP7_9ASPA
MGAYQNPAVASQIPSEFQPEWLPSPAKTSWEDFSGQNLELEEDGESDSLQWLSIFMEDCLSGTTAFAWPAPLTSASSSENPTPVQTSNSLCFKNISVRSKSRNRGRKKMKTDPNFINYSKESPLLHQKHWLAESELLIIPKMEKISMLKPKGGNGNANHGGEEIQSLQPKRCGHCLSQRTPQWRAGPTGPKTLCNACGVRFKSGRLLPEYRPAKSPSFVSYKHSNSHKKVMEMRMSVLSPNFNGN